ncbi:MAG: ATPase [Clostridiales bacterium GWE2_32_10]|nr:MAG: ATPase [Clostridiales bacterium GWE2_32_10]HBY21588.1 ATPase [Clostridiales bacterium]
MFIGREKELSKLGELYEQDKFQMVVIYGRRRVGKTTLISEFCKDKEHIFFSAEIMNEKLNLKKFTKSVTSYFKVDYIKEFSDFEDGCKFLYSQAKDERVVLVMDEFPYLINSNKTIASILQNMIDHNFKNSKLFLILCGSSISFMEKEVLGYNSPLYGRRTYQMEIKPFSIYEVQSMFKDYTKDDIVKLYSIVGGTPHYLNQLDPNKSLDENIKSYVLDYGSYLYTEPIDLLRQELREVAVYNSILTAIANGASKLNEIATTIGEKTDKTANYIKTLIELRLLDKVIPITEKSNSKKAIYVLKDNLFKFYYKYIINNKELLEQGEVDVVYKNLDEDISVYIGHIFEDICVEYLRKANIKRELPFLFEKIGKWWGNNKIRMRQEEIDITALDNDNIMFCECKWRNEKMKLKVLNELKEKVECIDIEGKKVYYYLFSKSGFEESLILMSENDNNNIKLINLEKIFS